MDDKEEKCVSSKLDEIYSMILEWVGHHAYPDIAEIEDIADIDDIGLMVF